MTDDYTDESFTATQEDNGCVINYSGIQIMGMRISWTIVIILVVGILYSIYTSGYLNKMIPVANTLPLQVGGNQSQIMRNFYAEGSKFDF